MDVPFNLYSQKSMTIRSRLESTAGRHSHNFIDYKTVKRLWDFRIKDSSTSDHQQHQRNAQCCETLTHACDLLLSQEEAVRTGSLLRPKGGYDSYLDTPGLPSQPDIIGPEPSSTDRVQGRNAVYRKTDRTEYLLHVQTVRYQPC